MPEEDLRKQIVATIGMIPLAQYGTPSTQELPNVKYDPNGPDYLEQVVENVLAAVR